MPIFGHMGYGMFWDPTYILVMIGIGISLLASARVKSTFVKYSNVKSASGMTGADAASRILQMAGINDVRIERIAGDMTDHYDPKNKVLCLSETVYAKTSVAAIGVAAHECGHAIQDNKEYIPLRVRGALVPVANFGSSISWGLIILGLVLSIDILIPFGIMFFSAAVLFQLVTLPVEFDASHRALVLLGDSGILYQDEVGKARKVLNAAALTYVAAAAASVLQLLRLILLFGGRNRD